MGSGMIGKKQLTLRLVVSNLMIVKRFNRPIMFFVFLLFLPVLVQASPSVGGNLIVNGDFEWGPSSWATQGYWAGIENCCGQHDTPYWGYGRSDPDTWDGGLEPAGQFTRLYQNQNILGSYTWRLSTWAATNGMTSYARAYFPGRTIACGSVATSTYTPVSCEFSASNGESIMIAFEGSGNSPQWAVSDDWALTPLIAPLPQGWPTWTTLPVKYWVNTYTTRTDMAAWSWNDSVGKQLLIKVSDINQAKIRFNAQYFNDWFWGLTHPPVNGVVVIDIDRTDVDPWNLYSYGLDVRQALFAHEFGHALGLGDQTASCILMNTNGLSTFWYCATFRPTSVDANAMRAIYP
jgi:hypothetical protein